MRLPLGFYDISLWLAITAIILLATSELLSPHYGQTGLIMEKGRLRTSALILGVLFLPGFTLIKTLFPTREIDNIERTALSIGMSLALVPLVGLLLNYTPWGIRLTPITISLLALTIILSITGLIREHQEKTPEKSP